MGQKARQYSQTKKSHTCNNSYHSILSKAAPPVPAYVSLFQTIDIVQFFFSIFIILICGFHWTTRTASMTTSLDFLSQKIRVSQHLFFFFDLQ